MDEKTNLEKFCEDTGDAIAFLISKIGELNAITEILYEKLEDNNIDMSDFKARYENVVKAKTKQVLEDCKGFSNRP